jgi:cobyrinic acid a,c-diamide synthase
MPEGTRLRGHEFHWSVADEPPPSIAAYRVAGSDRMEGFCLGATLASYVHLNLASAPALAHRFVNACATSTWDNSRA